MTRRGRRHSNSSGACVKNHELFSLVLSFVLSLLFPLPPILPLSISLALFFFLDVSFSFVFLFFSLPLLFPLPPTHSLLICSYSLMRTLSALVAFNSFIFSSFLLFYYILQLMYAMYRLSCQTHETTIRVI